MEYIEAVFNQNYASVILAVFLLLFAIKEAIDLISYFKKQGRIKTGSEQDKENVENRLITLEKHDNWQYKEISKMSKGTIAQVGQMCLMSKMRIYYPTSVSEKLYKVTLSKENIQKIKEKFDELYF